MLPVVGHDRAALITIVGVKSRRVQKGAEVAAAVQYGHPIAILDGMRSFIGIKLLKFLTLFTTKSVQE